MIIIYCNNNKLLKARHCFPVPPIRKLAMSKVALNSQPCYSLPSYVLKVTGLTYKLEWLFSLNSGCI